MNKFTELYSESIAYFLITQEKIINALSDYQLNRIIDLSREELKRRGI